MAVQERIRQKVFAGNRLSDEELAELEQEARRDGGPVLKVMVAQALINNEQSRKALALLEGLRGDFPGHAQVHLALARALAALERWNEVEAPLKRALELQPGDPEALKVLAVLAVRRGEWARAQALAEEVLKVDPFDAEAQQLSATLAAAAQGELTGPPTREAFLRALTERLARSSTPHLVAQDRLHLKLGKGLVRLDVDSLYEAFVASGAGLDASVDAMAKELSARTLALPRNKLLLLGKVLPVLRPAAFLEKAEGATHREAPAGLLIFYVLEDGELVRYLPEAALEAFRIDPSQLDKAAFKNLGQRPGVLKPIRLVDGALQLVDGEGDGLWALATGDGHDGARLLLKSQQDAIAQRVGPGPWRVYLGLRELVLLCRAGDEAQVQHLSGLGAAKDGIEGSYLLEGGVLKALPEWAL